MTVRPLAAVLAVLTTGASCSGMKSQAASTSPRSSVSADRPVLTPCAVASLPGRVSCGTVRVPESRARRGSRYLDLAVVIAHATGPTVSPDPFVLLAGGPGQAGTRMAPFASEAFGLVRENRDLVLVDARGTGKSNGLRCAMVRNARDLGGWTLMPSASVRHCRDSLSAGADLSEYTTAAIADDLEAVRVAFGWPALNLYGTSYGSRVALVYARRHPNSVRAIVAKAVAPPTLIAPMNYAEDAEQAFSLLVRDCRADSACSRAFPQLRADLDSVLVLANRGNIRAIVRDSVATDTVVVSRDGLASVLLSILQSSGSRASLPLLLHKAAGGDAAPLGALVVQTFRSLDQALYSGMQLSVLCGEDGRRLDTLSARQDDGRTFLGSARVRMLAAACRDWILPPPTPAAHDPVRATVPVLLVSGELDPNTPPRHAESALRFLPNGRHVVLRGVAHGWSNVRGCGATFVADFVRRASVRNLDVACAAVSSAPPFVLQ